MTLFRCIAIFTPLILVIILNSGYSQQVTREPKRVAIFLYDGVELLDFAGPGEVFTAAGFKTYTVSVEGNALTSQGFVKIHPEFSMDAAPTPDILVFPGGSAGPTSNTPSVIQWIKKLQREGCAFMSVCTGAFILAKAGLLDEKRVTTHWGSIKSLAIALPKSTVLEHTRFVDNGSVITTAGVSAGIDGALHLVSRIKGMDAAKRTARYMEYDKWNPQDGTVDKKNEYLQKLQQPADAQGNSKPGTPSADQVPYLGEFKNEAVALKEKGEYVHAEQLLKAGIKFYHSNSASLYSELTEIYVKQGKPAPTTSSALIAMIREGKVDDAVARLEKDAKAFPGWQIFGEEELNEAGYYLMFEKNDVNSAIKVFLLNVREYPESFVAYDSLGEAYLKAGKKDLAIVNYKKSLMLDGDNANARKILAEMGVNN